MPETCPATSHDSVTEAIDRLAEHGTFVQVLLRLPECQEDMLAVLRLLGRIREQEGAHAAELARDVGAKVGDSLEMSAEPGSVRYSLAKNLLAGVVEAWLASQRLPCAIETRDGSEYFVFEVGASRVGTVENFLLDVKFDERYPYGIERRMAGGGRGVTAGEAHALRYASPIAAR